jgi:hypothetical protein
MTDLTEQERADLWVKTRLHEVAVRERILRRLSSNPQAITELITEWAPLLAHLDEREQGRTLVDRTDKDPFNG